MQRGIAVWQIPPRASGRSYRAAEWAPPAAKQIATCRMRVVAQGKAAWVRLEDGTTGELFAETPVREPLDRFVEPVTGQPGPQGTIATVQGRCPP